MKLLTQIYTAYFSLNINTWLHLSNSDHFLILFRARHEHSAIVDHTRSHPNQERLHDWPKSPKWSVCRPCHRRTYQSGVLKVILKSQSKIKFGFVPFFHFSENVAQFGSENP